MPPLMQLWLKPRGRASHRLLLKSSRLRIQRFSLLLLVLKLVQLLKLKLTHVVMLLIDPSGHACRAGVR